jgi:hypothetical protein
VTGNQALGKMCEKAILGITETLQWGVRPGAELGSTESPISGGGGGGPGQSPRRALTRQGFSLGNSACRTRRLLVTYSGPLRRVRLVVQWLYGFLPVPRWAKTEGWTVNFCDPSYLESHSRMKACLIICNK